MKKRIVAIIAALFMAVTPMMSQVFIMEDDINMNRAAGDGVVFNVMVGSQDVNNDQFLPIGGGTAILLGLGGAYLLGKKRKKSD